MMRRTAAAHVGETACVTGAGLEVAVDDLVHVGFGDLVEPRRAGIPALFTRMSIGPSAARTSPTSAARGRRPTRPPQSRSIGGRAPESCRAPRPHRPRATCSSRRRRHLLRRGRARSLRRYRGWRRFDEGYARGRVESRGQALEAIESTERTEQRSQRSTHRDENDILLKPIVFRCLRWLRCSVWRSVTCPSELTLAARKRCTRSAA